MCALNHSMPLPTLSLHNKPGCYSLMALKTPTPNSNSSTTSFSKSNNGNTNAKKYSLEWIQIKWWPMLQNSQTLCQTDLVHLHHHHYLTTPKPAMHQHGSSPIDVMVRHPLLAMALAHTWVLPFGIPPLVKGNHCLLGLDIYPNILLVEPLPIYPNLPWDINSWHTQNVQKFCMHAINYCNKHQLADGIDTFMACKSLTPHSLKELNNKLIIHSQKSL